MAQVFRRDIVVIGASSGGLEPLMEIVAGLPADIEASLFVVVHVPAQATSQLPHILSRAGRLPAIHAQDGEAILPRHIYVAPPDYHLLLGHRSLRIVRGPKENNHRPAIDPLFRSAARAHAARTIGIVLSGMLDDGTAGLLAIKERGGIAIVQDPKDALFPAMPRNALAATRVDYCVPKDQIAGIIVDLTRKSDIEMGDTPMISDDEMNKEIEIEAMNTATIADDGKPGSPSVYGCPDCGGTLWELQDDQWLRFRCRVGHAYSAEGLLESQGEGLESALWSAFRSLQESAALARRIAERARGNKRDLAAEKFELKSRRAEVQARLIRELLVSGQGETGAETD